MKIKKRIITIGLMLTALLQMMVPIAFAQDVSPQASDYILSTDYQIYQNSSGGLSVYFEIRAYDYMDSIGASKIQIDRWDGSYWIPEKTYWASSTTGMLSSNTWAFDNTKTYSGVSSGSTYRAKISFYVCKGSGSDSRVTTTSSVRIK